MLKNSECADCDSNPVTHISVQTGITLCPLCAGQHMSQLSDITLTLPIKDTQWQPELSKALEKGGNAKWNEWMANFDHYICLREKYASPPASHYRKYVT